MQRYFGIGKKENQMILEDGDLYHIMRVMRMKHGDYIEVVWKKEVFLCSIKCIDTVNEKIAICIEEKLPVTSDFMKQIILVLPLLKEQKMDLILQKATELGVSEIIPVSMKRSVVKIEDNRALKKIERWNKIMKEASEQCMRHTIPILHSIASLDEISSMDGLKMLCSTTEKKNTVKFFLQTHQNYDKLIIVIGPEGGLDPEEELKLCKSGFISVTLGPRIMRVETVPIYLLSILNYEYME